MFSRRKIIAFLSSIILAMSMFSPMSAFAVENIDELGGKPVESYPRDVQVRLPEISANCWAVADSNGNILWSHNGYEPVKIASVTKMMTAIVAADYPMDTQIVVSEYASSIPGSSAYIHEGDIITLSELLEGLMLPSGNDAAYAIAEGLGELMLIDDGASDAKTKTSEEKVERFIGEMNKKSSELNLKDTFFVNPCGLDDEGFEGEHHSCAVDVAIMAKAVMANERLAQIADTSYEEMDAIREGEPITTPMVNSNRLLEQREEEAAGVKTGFTDAAGSCLAGCGNIDGDLYYTACLGCESAIAMYYDTALLWDWVRASRLDMDYMAGYGRTENGDYIIGELAANEWTDKTYRIAVKNSDNVPQWYWEGNYNFIRSIDNPDSSIHKGDVVGSLDIVDHYGNVVEHMDVFAVDDVESPSWWEAICIFFSRLFSPLTGSPTTAQDVYYDSSPELRGTHYSPQTVAVQF